MRLLELPEDAIKTIEQEIKELSDSLSKQPLDWLSKQEHDAINESQLDSLNKRLQKSQKSQLWHKSCSSLSQFLAKGLDEENRAHYTDLQNGWFEAHPRRVAWLLSFKFLVWDRLAVWFESMLLKISLIQRFISS